MADNAVRPDIDAVLVNGVRVACGSRVRLRPGRRADAQDMFFAGRTARVTSVHEDVDGEQHVGVVVEDDPAADLHEWYGRYLYFAPDEIEPLDTAEISPRKESDMDVIGRITTLVIAAAVVAGVVVGVKSMPDVQRYLKMRQM